MSWSRRSGRRGYHHGNLREALIQGALDLIAQKGPSGFTVAEAARSAGVSPGAPYRHFRDREELLADVALRGFEHFAIELEQAWNGGKPDVMEALQNLGRAYLRFARGEPAYYSAMFEVGLPHDSNPALRHASERAFNVLLKACEALCVQLPKPSRPPPLMMALHIWAMSHGIASLFGRGDGSARKLPMSPEDLLEANVLLYIRGLGLAGGASSGPPPLP
ncbi:MAG TPA: TetR/AcrR family transcriptional regulator [Xanthobacteraceae bacterium]|jgi:AcrR family transcriptional regulator|nr:TetR/AcrR family transcriptional regulator [Xanthobacteraceae bacterium]